MLNKSFRDCIFQTLRKIMSEGNDGFVVVKSKKKSKNLYKQLSPSNRLIKNLAPDSNEVNELIYKLKKIQNQLLSHDPELYASKFLFNLRNILDNFFSKSYENPSKKIVILCYGLGSFDDSISSRYQLALLLIMIDYLKENIGIQVEIKEIFDPLFNSIDKSVLEKILDYQYSDFNSKCIKKIDMNSNNYLSIVFMPHCPKALYNNLLFSNWNKTHLQCLLIIGNSFESIRSLNNHEHFVKNYCFLNESIKFSKEQKFDFKCDLTNAFYDLSFIIFETNKAIDLLINFYEDNFDLNSLKSPVYDINEEII